MLMIVIAELIGVKSFSVGPGKIVAAAHALCPHHRNLYDAALP